MGDDRVVIQHPVLQEIKFPKTNLIMLDISKFNPDSYTQCYEAVQQALKEKGIET